MIKEKDQGILNFIEDFHIATSGQIYRLFYPNSYRYCMKRLNNLVEHGFLKLTVSTINNCHAYYIDKKPVQLHHDLIRTELFVNLKEKYKILDWSNEQPVKHIRPDALTYVQKSAFTYIDDNGIVFPLFIEVHLNNKFNFDKYKDLIRTTNLRDMFGIMPRVIICTDRQVSPPIMGIKFKIVGLDMKGLDTLFK